MGRLPTSTVLTSTLRTLTNIFLVRDLAIREQYKNFISILPTVIGLPNDTKTLPRIIKKECWNVI